MAANKQPRKGLRFWLRQVSLRTKFATLTVCIVVLLLASGWANIRAVSRLSRQMQTALNDNLASYDLQQAMTEEAKAFLNMVRLGTDASRTAFHEACTLTQTRLAMIPYDYEQTGEKRFEVTWTIRNSYAQYKKQRDKVVAMNPEDSDYIHELYTAYYMQDYLQEYCAQLTAATLQDSKDAYASASGQMLRIPYLLGGTALLAMALVLMLLYVTLGSVFRALRGLAQASQDIEKNVFSSPDLQWQSHDEMGQLMRAFNKMKHATGRYVQATQEKQAMEDALHRQELERMELEKRFSSVQLQMIKNQLNPHFLFNTLNTIARMARVEGAPVSEQMTMAVSNLLRYNLRTTDPIVPLAHELKAVEDYMYIQQMRFGERVRYRVDCQVDAATAQVPVFLLQPLVENAVIHGLSNQEKGGGICVCVRRSGGLLRIAVTDTGGGMDPQRLEDVRAAMQHEGDGLGVGLGNICRRIRGFYEEGGVAVYSKQGCGTAVLLTFGNLKQEWM